MKGSSLRTKTVRQDRGPCGFAPAAALVYADHIKLPDVSHEGLMKNG